MPETPRFSYYKGDLSSLQGEFRKEVNQGITFPCQMPRILNYRAKTEKILRSPLDQLYMFEVKREWDRLNHRNLYVDQVLSFIYNVDFSALPPEDIEFLAKLNENSSLNIETRPYVLLHKTKVEQELKSTRAETLNEEEFSLLISPSTMAEERYVELQKLRINEASKKPKYPRITSAYVAEKYFNGSEQSLKSKIAKRSPLKSIKKAIKEVAELEERRLVRDGETRYLLMEHPRFTFIHELLRYDNYFEHFFIMNLFSMPDLFFRRYILAGLQANGFIDKRGSNVYEYTEEEVSAAIYKYLEYLKEQSNQSTTKTVVMDNARLTEWINLKSKKDEILS